MSDDLVRAIAETARAVFGATACSVALVSADATEMVFTTASGGAESGVEGLTLPMGAGIVGWVATTGQSVAVRDLSTDPRFSRETADHLGYVPSSILASPIETDERLIGVMEILDRDDERPGAENDLQLLHLFSRLAALAIDGSRRAEHIQTALRSTVVGASPDEQAEAGELAEVATAFTRLAALGNEHRRLAVRLLNEICDFAEPGRR